MRPMISCRPFNSRTAIVRQAMISVVDSSDGHFNRDGVTWEIETLRWEGCYPRDKPMRRRDDIDPSQEDTFRPPQHGF